MNLNSFKESIIIHFRENLCLYVLSAICICTGIVLGVYTVKYMSSFEKSDLLSYISSFSKVNSASGINYYEIFMQTIKNNVPVIFIIWFFGLTMIGIPLILVIDVIKGFTIGFTVTFFVSGLGINGVWLSMLSVVPQNIIYIPCIMIASVLAMEFSFRLIKNTSKRLFTKSIYSKIMAYTILFLVINVVMLLGFVFETYISPNIIRAMA